MAKTVAVSYCSVGVSGSQKSATRKHASHFNNLFYSFSGSKCKDRWESLRGQYRKHINKITKSGQAATHSTKWKYEEQMSFLRPLFKDRERVTSLQQEDTEIEVRIGDTNTQELCNEPVHQEKDEASDNNETIPEAGPSRTKKRKKEQSDTSASATLMKYLVERKKEEQPTNPIDTFFSLMATTVKNFKPVDQNFIKSKVFSLVNDVELKYLTQEEGGTHAPQTYTCPLPTPSPALSYQSTPSPAISQQLQDDTNQEPSVQPYNLNIWHNNENNFS